MSEIKCPNCGKVFNLDESQYAQILQQVNDVEIDKRVNEKVTSRLEVEKSHHETELDKQKNKLNSKIEGLEDKLKNFEATKELEIKTVQADKDKEIEQLKSQIDKLKTENELNIQKEVDSKQQEINNLNNKLLNIEQQWNSQKEIDNANHENALLNIEKDKENELNNQKIQYESKIKSQQEEIERIKDYRKKLSTKMLGENLEQHCEISFNQIRATAFPNAYFDKDNDSSKGSKGDYIFRDFHDDVEYISIMFEMKNEDDETATKHKNEDFLPKLDKDRNSKDCEYAVLVSMLEQDSDLYNNGIVDMSHRYPKMYVIRPQFFIPLITVLRNASQKSISDKLALKQMREENIDITNFEEKLTNFQEGFKRNWDLASKRFGTAIDEIDKSIDHLRKIKENLLKCDDKLRIANNKAQDVTIKKLTYNNPTMKKKFKDISNNNYSDQSANTDDTKTKLQVVDLSKDMNEVTIEPYKEDSIRETEKNTNIKNSTYNSKSSVSDVVFYLKQTDREAHGKRNDDGTFVLATGSELASEAANSCPAFTLKLRSKNKDKIKNNITTEDIVFKSPSGAASFVTLSSKSGNACWKDSSGKTLGQYLSGN